MSGCDWTGLFKDLKVQCVCIATNYTTVACTVYRNTWIIASLPRWNVKGPNLVCIHVYHVYNK